MVEEEAGSDGVHDGRMVWPALWGIGCQPDPLWRQCCSHRDGGPHPGGRQPEEGHCLGRGGGCRAQAHFRWGYHLTVGGAFTAGGGWIAACLDRVGAYPRG